MAPVRLTVVSTEAEADILCGRLRASGIECGHRKTDMGAGQTLGYAPGGPTEVLVDEADLADARELLEL